MSIAFYRWKEIGRKTRARIMRRSRADIESVKKTVRPIIKDVKERGDEALRDYARKFESADIDCIQAMPEDFERAEAALDENLKAAIKHCARNVRTFHEEQMRRVEKSWMVEIEPGVFAGEQVSAIPSVGLYVPRGKGAFPSAMYMLCLPAVIAGVAEIAVVTPPTPEGGIDAASLYTARLCGVETVYKAGGAQAIAALAYGTETVPKVAKVLGPGSPYVAAAKSLLSEIIDPGMPAGPSEAVILADESADPHNTCLDLLNEAEHGEDSAALLVTHDEDLAQYIRDNLPGVIDDLPEPHRSICRKVMGPDGYGGIIRTENLEDSVAFANAYAPEHLHVKLSEENLGRVLPPHLSSLRSDSLPPAGGGKGWGGDDPLLIRYAGEILIGEHTPSSLGNYGIGVNHVLPTGGAARTYSCTSVWDFLKRTSLARVDKAGFESLKGPVTTLTEYENFPAHGNVLKKRKSD